MNEEKLDRIDRRLTELVNITGNLVATVTELTQQTKANTEQLGVHSQQIGELTNQQRTLTNQLADVACVVIDTSKKHEEFKKNIESRVSVIEDKVAI